MAQAMEKKNLDTDQPVPSELGETSGCIGIHVLLRRKIKFFQYNETVQAEVAGVAERVPVELPEISSQYNPCSVATKVKQLLRNFHLRPNYQSEPERKVCFETIAPSQKTWEKQAIVRKLPDDLVWICRRNNTISYAYANTVITWDWINNTSTLKSYQTTKITALAENVEGDLVVGDERGQLFISDQILFTGKEAPIEKIIYSSRFICLFKFKDDEDEDSEFKDNEKLFDIELKKLIPIPIKGTQKYGVLDNGRIVIWYQEEMFVLQYDITEKQYKRVITRNYPNLIRNIHLIPNAKFLIEHKDDTGTLWDVREESHDSQKAKNYASLFTIYTIGQTLLVLDRQTLVYGKVNGTNVNLVFVSKNNEKRVEAPIAGSWLITAMILLSDGSIMYATNATPSGIHVVTRNGELAFTENVTLTENKLINSLKGLSDGSVAAEYYDTKEHLSSIFILEPRMIMEENVDYTTEPYGLKLRCDSNDLECYFELADHYTKKKRSKKEIYQVYLSALEAAVQSNHLYQARRFYEKARQIHRLYKEPCETFLSYLETTPNKQLTRRIHLDLLILPNCVDKFPNSLTNRRCKRRLLIGEGDFSFTEALINKHQNTHPNLSKVIIATDLTATHLNDSQTEEENQLKQRIADLKQSGVNVLFGVNAEQIHRTFKGKRFKRIQWNCPFGEATDRERFKKTIPCFFQSCSKLQLPDDRVHVTLMQKSGDYCKERQIENPIVLGSAEAGYRLIRKRSFRTYGEERYPGYIHVKTRTTAKYPKREGEEEQEFVFEKTDQVFPEATLKEARELMDPQKKKYDINTDSRRESDPPLEEYYFECSTDQDSSDYYESDSDEEL